MSISAWPVSHRDGVAAFYSSGHTWSWEQMTSGSAAAGTAIFNWLTKSPAPPNAPLLLPRVGVPGAPKAIRWYAVAFTDAQFEALREQLNAFLGPAGTDYRGLRTPLDPVDPPEAALLAWIGADRVFVINVIASRKDDVREAMERLRQIWHMQPSARSASLRTTEALLRNFFSALTNGDEEAALHWLSELQAGGRLSAENQSFLQVERMAAFGRWREILASPLLSQLLMVPRPRRVTTLLVEAIWRGELEPFAGRGDAVGACTHFRAEILPRFGVLFRARGGATAPPVVLAFLVAACACDPPRREQIPSLLALLGSGTEAEFGISLAALLPPVAAVVEKPLLSSVESARAALLHDDFERAWELVQDAPLSIDKLRVMIECAAEIATADAARAVLAAFDALPPTVAEELLAVNRRRRALEGLRQLTSDSEVAPLVDWESWLARVGSDPSTPRLLETAHNASQQWPIAQYLEAPARVEAFATQLIQTREPASENLLRLALPHVVAYFVPRGVAEAAFVPVYANLLFLLAVGDRFAAADWAICQTLLTSILEAGADPKTYADAVTGQAELWQRFGSVQRLDWGLDALDLLAIHPCADAAARDALFTVIQETFAREYRRIASPHWALFRLLCSDLGRTEAYNALRSSQPEAAPEARRIDLTGRMVGIYTLTASAGVHAKAAIEQLFPGVDVRLNNDHVGSERLKALAREADYFVVATRSAKHAATIFLKDHRPAHTSPLIYPSGKGASSIVSALVMEVNESN